VNNIDKIRQIYLLIAEFLDSWRVAPRLIVFGYAVIIYQVVSWYMGLQPYMLEGCDVNLLKDKCIVEAPTTMHTALLTAMVGFATGIFGFYTTTGRKWGEGFKFWNKSDKDPEPKKQD
jgi:hypothetical protein